MTGSGLCGATGPRAPQALSSVDKLALDSGKDRLLQAAEEMEGMFLRHLTTALRATVPGGGNPDAPGAAMYTSLMDEYLADTLAADTRTGIAEALYKQLSNVVSAPIEAGESSAMAPESGKSSATEHVASAGRYTTNFVYRVD
jgi:Rod binding domain-containing protein